MVVERVFVMWCTCGWNPLQVWAMPSALTMFCSFNAHFLHSCFYCTGMVCLSGSGVKHPHTLTHAHKRKLHFFLHDSFSPFFLPSTLS